MEKGEERKKEMGGEGEKHGRAKGKLRKGLGDFRERRRRGEKYIQLPSNCLSLNSGGNKGCFGLLW